MKNLLFIILGILGFVLSVYGSFQLTKKNKKIGVKQSFTGLMFALLSFLLIFGQKDVKKNEDLALLAASYTIMLICLIGLFYISTYIMIEKEEENKKQGWIPHRCFFI